jgi:hypothetical protein
MEGEDAGDLAVTAVVVTGLITTAGAFAPRKTAAVGDGSEGCGGVYADGGVAVDRTCEILAVFVREGGDEGDEGWMVVKDGEWREVASQ